MKILLATEDPDLRLSMELVLSAEPAVTVVGSASESEGLLALIKSTQPAIVLLDWGLPSRPLAGIITEAYHQNNTARFIVLGPSPAERKPALSAGASAYVVKGEPPEQLLAAFRATRKQTMITPAKRSQGKSTSCE